MFQDLTAQLHGETSSLQGGGEGEADLSKGEHPWERPGEADFENRGFRTNARRLEQWVCGECLRGDQGSNRGGPEASYSFPFQEREMEKIEKPRTLGGGHSYEPGLRWRGSVERPSIYGRTVIHLGKDQDGVRRRRVVLSAPQ